MQIVYYGHSCFLLDYNGKKLLFDPFIKSNDLAAHINIEDINCDFILISHGHRDHLEDTQSIAERTKAKIISSYEIVSYFKNKGLEGHPMNIGGSWDFDFGNVKLTHSVHSSSFPDGTYAGTPVGFVISGGGSTIYFSGDTALTLDMKLIPMTSPSLDYAILPIGDNFTMGYKDAVIAAKFISCENIIACHYDTFGYIKVDQAEVKKVFEENSLNISFLEIGKPTTF